MFYLTGRSVEEKAKLRNVMHSEILISAGLLICALAAIVLAVFTKPIVIWTFYGIGVLVAAISIFVFCAIFVFAFLTLLITILDYGKLTK